MPEELDNQELSLKLYIVMHHAFNSLQDQSFKDMKSYGLNPTEFAVLELLYNKGPQQIQQIGERVLLSSGSITYVVNNLIEEGYVVRKQYEMDRRIAYVYLKPKGKKLMNEIFPKHAEQLEKITNGLNAGEKKKLIETLKKLGKNVE
ncbi:MarR family winged helix-turn-helix transcriptional regulator [Salinicoccus halodurans]|uniref:Transcriptional regulator n=1 Tax=Salinicoccus halodurans TaxID=407035 RepID=A0A0F7HIG4_9STAP|nr:MarR family transcriptional regulator [Salinicoccus halodurans]AKG73053.1 transcriptional regulator [Salinicoccus halodurans]SFK78133.1 MarR family transcriptional regulator, 2-MHQ and catechol-resistance regulon repressor [Salinicoccus halodurans]